MNRRQFLLHSSLLWLGLGVMNKPVQGQKRNEKEIRKFLQSILYSKEEVDNWFAGKAFPFSKHHPEFGWLLNDAKFRDGINKSFSIYTYAKNNGERLMSNYREKPCRINTYGNSYTQCHQVSDHETWQEVLAAHLQEPVRNFGIGGWSVYQAYLRMKYEEKKTPAEYIIFNIYEDDHLRNLDSWRNIRVRKHPQHIEATLPYVKVDLKNKTIIECANPCPSKDSYYQLCDLEKTYGLFKDDFVLHIMLTHQKSEQLNPDQQYKAVMNLTKTHGIETKIETSATLSHVADQVHRKAGLLATEKIVEKVEAFAQDNGKIVLYVLSYPAKYIARSVQEGRRWDKPFINFLDKNKLPYIDLHRVHLKEFKQFNIKLKKYLNRYFIGHYNPWGNFFCAHAIRDKLIELLNPKPLPYQK